MGTERSGVCVARSLYFLDTLLLALAILMDKKLLIDATASYRQRIHGKEKYELLRAGMA
jgi:hypothetical protein